MVSRVPCPRILRVILMTLCAPSPTAQTPTRKRRRRSIRPGLAQLSLVEHALCPLDTNVSLKEGFQ